MAGKPRNRMELRRQYEAAEPVDPMEDEGDDAEAPEEGKVEPKGKKKPKAAPKKPKATKTKAAKPSARMKIVWQVVNDAFKPVATFEFGQRAAAETKAAEMTAKGRGTHFIQKLKEAMPDDAPGLGAIIPRQAVASATPKKPTKSRAKKQDVEVEEEEIEEEEEEEEEEDDE